MTCPVENYFLDVAVAKNPIIITTACQTLFWKVGTENGNLVGSQNRGILLPRPPGRSIMNFWRRVPESPWLVEGLDMLFLPLSERFLW